MSDDKISFTRDITTDPGSIVPVLFDPPTAAEVAAAVARGNAVRSTQGGETSAVTVCQADRDAAAKWVAPNYPAKHASGFADDIAAGNCDMGALVQAFARHRVTSTPQAASAEVREAVRQFAVMMEAALAAKDRKRGETGWKGMTEGILADKLIHKLHDLIDARHDDPINIKKIGREAAGVANYAMMMADVLGALGDTKCGN